MLKTSSGHQAERTATTTITPAGAARGRRRLTQALRRAAMSGAGLGDSDFRVLEVLLHKGPLPVNTIGAKVWLTPGSISVAIDRLETKALVKRKNIDDRRVRMVELTAKGRALITKTFRVHAAPLEEAAAVLSKEESLVWLRLLKKLEKGAGG